MQRRILPEKSGVFDVGDDSGMTRLERVPADGRKQLPLPSAGLDDFINDAAVDISQPEIAT